MINGPQSLALIKSLEQSSNCLSRKRPTPTAQKCTEKCSVPRTHRGLLTWGSHDSFVAVVVVLFIFLFLDENAFCYFGPQASTQSTEPHQPGQCCLISKGPECASFLQLLKRILFTYF